MGFDGIGIVVGLKAEAKIARRLGGEIAVGGGGARGAMRAAESLIAKGVTALVSFGLAGGLDPSLRPGRVIVPRAVLLDGQPVPTDPGLSARLGGMSDHLILAGTDVLDTADSKRRRWRSLHTHAIDLESGAVAQVALVHGLPFAVLRAVCDPANCSLPPAARVALDNAGAIGMWRVLRSVLKAPSQVPDLLALGRDAAKARAALERRVGKIAGGSA